MRGPSESNVVVGSMPAERYSCKSGGGTLLEEPFDRFERYSAVQRVVELVRRRRGLRRLRVLDVGGFLGCADRFLPSDEVFVVDLAESRMLNYVLASGACLPFADRTFDLVISLDTLEHVPPAQRGAFATELHRVTKDVVALTAPFANPETELAERFLFEFIRNVLQTEHVQLGEHLSLGLPRLEDYLEWAHGTGAATIILPVGHLHTWLLLMTVRHFLMSLPKPQPLLALADRFFNTHYAERDRRLPAYRHLVISSCANDGALLAELSEPQGSPGGSISDLAAPDIIMLANVLGGLAMQRTEPALAAARQRESAAIEECARLRARVQYLEEHIQAVANGRVMRLLKWLNRLTGGC